jgi:hypothetical protein
VHGDAADNMLGVEFTPNVVAPVGTAASAAPGVMDTHYGTYHPPASSVLSPPCCALRVVLSADALEEGSCRAAARRPNRMSTKTT